jgi:outer membrane receptor protein involved in Fe transport
LEAVGGRPLRAAGRPGTAGAQLNWYWQADIDNTVETIDPTFPRSAVDIQSYDLANFRADYRFDEYGLELAIFVNNLLGQEYRTGFLDLSTLGYGIVNEGDPRTYGVTLHWDF